MKEKLKISEELKQKCKEYWKARSEFEQSNTENKEPIYLADKDKVLANKDKELAEALKLIEELKKNKDN